MSYIGRFAPSPTGPLHFGSLVAALGSLLQARAAGGRWLLRMEDIDPPREVAGAADAILRALDAYGLHWDGEVMYQSRRNDAYDEALARLLREDRGFVCLCSRREATEAAAAAGMAPGVYPGTCRARHHRAEGQYAIRARVEPGELAFEDRLQGPQRQAMESEVGDFVVRRADGLYAYQLAVVVDDAEQGISEVVRGADLLDSTPRQIHLQRLLELPTPHYLHLPLAVNPLGQKLSKQSHAPAIDPAQALPALRAALAFLGQQTPPELADANRDELLAWAVAHWDPARIPRGPQVVDASP